VVSSGVNQDLKYEELVKFSESSESVKLLEFDKLEK
jgi:hypothetical protein